MLHVDQNHIIKNTTLYGIIQGKKVYKVTLQNKDISIEITNLGCSISAINTPDRNGVKKNIVAGFKELKDYEINKEYFGSVLGRYSNRIAGGQFILDGENISLSVNDGVNHLHGGFNGFNKKIWDIISINQYDDQMNVEFEYLSSDGEEGYPGQLHIKVKYILNNKNQLCIEYHAETDKATPVSLSNHSYFNLTGFENPLVTDHILYVNSLSYLEKNEHNVPTGNVLAVLGTPLDFLSPHKISTNINRFPLDRGFDHSFVLKDHLPGEFILSARLKDSESGRRLDIFTDQKSIHVYTANFWDGTISGRQGCYYQKHGAVALETQAFPDSPNHALFPDTVLKPGDNYFHTTIYEFGVE